MIAMVGQIQQVAVVRASAGNVGLSRPAPIAIPTNGSGEAAKSAATEVEVQARPAPVADDHGLRLTVNSNTHEVLATLVNTETNEVIRTIPGEETRRAREVIRAIAGQLLDKHA
jgi:hypothetical protein